MARSGSRFDKPKKANIRGVAVGLERLGGLPPHPDIPRTGQRYWQRAGDRKTTMVVTGVTADGMVRVVRSIDRQRTLISPHPLLATGPDGLGTHWLFCGWLPWLRANDVHDRDIHDHGYRRRSPYRTMVIVSAGPDERGDVELCAPELHPNLRFSQFGHLIAFHRPGTWLSAHLDLGTFNPGRLRGSLQILGPASEREIARGRYFLGGGQANRPDRLPRKHPTEVRRGQIFRAVDRGGAPVGRRLYVMADPQSSRVVCADTQRKHYVTLTHLLDPVRYRYLGSTNTLPVLATPKPRLAPR